MWRRNLKLPVIRSRVPSITRPTSLSTPMATSMSPIVAITGFASSVPGGRPICNLIGDAQVLSKWGQQTVDANPDMAAARRRVKSLEPQYRFCFPTAVEFDPATDSVIVADSQRNRLQIYKKVHDYSDFQANL
jgi:hypothetical protein